MIPENKGPFSGGLAHNIETAFQLEFFGRRRHRNPHQRGDLFGGYFRQQTIHILNEDGVEMPLGHAAGNLGSAHNQKITALHSKLCDLMTTILIRPRQAGQMWFVFQTIRKRDGIQPSRIPSSTLIVGQTRPPEKTV